MSKYTNEELLSKVDHTLLAPTATKDDILTICQQAVENKVASICINPCYIPLAKEYLADRVAICTVIGFPLGANTTENKIAEAKNAIALGAVEVDMVANIGFIKSGEFALVEEEIRRIKEAVGNKILKVIIETCLLTDEEKVKMCHVVEAAGADFIKTSTGFSKAGATPEDIALFYREIGGRVKIKAAGGIKSREDMERFVSLGADRLGSSSAIKILNSQQTTEGY